LIKKAYLLISVSYKITTVTEIWVKVSLPKEGWRGSAGVVATVSLPFARSNTERESTTPALWATPP